MTGAIITVIVLFHEKRARESWLGDYNKVAQPENSTSTAEAAYNQHNH